MSCRPKPAVTGACGSCRGTSLIGPHGTEPSAANIHHSLTGAAMPGDQIGDAEPLQYPHAVGVEPNSRTDLAELGGLVVHPHFGSGGPSANAADRPPMPPQTTTTRNDRIATSWPLDSASTSFNGNGRYGSRVARLVSDRGLRRSGPVSSPLTPMNPPASWNRSYPSVAAPIGVGGNDN